MADLMTCPACHKQISSKARSCPGCGHRNERVHHRETIAIVLVIVLAVGGFLAYKENQKIKEDARRQVTTDCLAAGGGTACLGP